MFTDFKERGRKREVERHRQTDVGVREKIDRLPPVLALNGESNLQHFLEHGTMLQATEPSGWVYTLVYYPFSRNVTAIHIQVNHVFSTVDSILTLLLFSVTIEF